MIFENRRVGIGIGTMSMIPKRKKPCIVVREGNTCVKVASFNNEESAIWFLEKFEKFLEIPKEGDQE